jgi:SAM-dependent methyltransferase
MGGSGYTPPSLPTRVAASVSARGLRPAVGDFARWGTRLAAGLPFALTGATHGEFDFDGEHYPYLYGRYKRPWQTERAVEVPVVQRVVDRHAGTQILEVGNVLGHYRPQTHLVVDKYEQGPGVLNLDIFDLEREGLGAFDLIVAISTVEHVGWDEEPRVAGRALEAIRALERLLAPSGRLVLTVPTNYNPSLDAALREGAVDFAHQAALRRVGGGTHWRQVPPEEAWRAPYDFLLYSARGVLVATVERSSS